MVWAMAMVAMDWVTGAMAMVLAMEGATMVATGATMASVMLVLSLLLMLSPRLMLTPTTMEDMVWIQKLWLWRLWTGLQKLWLWSWLWKRLLWWLPWLLWQA